MRKILEDAWKVNELEDQFQNDCFSVEEIEKFYPDSYIISEANWRIEYCDMALGDYDDTDDPDYKIWLKDKNELQKFVKKWKNKCQPHPFDGLTYEEIIKESELPKWN